MTSDQQRRALVASTLGVHKRDRRGPFALFMALSVVIAVVGLMLDSAAVVIGAMLVAPLMSPILGIAAGLVLGWPRSMLSAIATVAVTVSASIALAWAVALVIPGAEPTSELLSRTAPDIRDLVVALAAGAAGAYALSREDTSTALPGVAVAVALVPPLAAAGMSLALGRGDLASGATLLFATNLLAIILTAALVFVVIGVVSRERLRLSMTRTAIGIALATVLVVALSVPLLDRTLAAVGDQRLQRDVSIAAQGALGSDSGVQVDRVEVGDDEVTVVLSGSAPPSDLDVRSRVQSAVGEDRTVRVVWLQEYRPDQSPPDAALSSAVLREARQAAASWIQTVDAEDARLESVSARGGLVLVSVSVVTGTPPDDTTLADAIEAAVGRPVRVELEWTERAAVDGDEDLRVAVSAWVDETPGLLLDDIRIGTDEVVVRVLGPRRPTNVAELRSVVHALRGSGVVVRVVYMAAREIT
ncbi:MAG: DUF389 domain-containing protein [Actinobacteria bacterium]|nr:DUF389 domain-containing protein [Actinomycetota bacterium]